MGAHVIAVANQKGGVGKTTTALSLAAALSRAGKSVLVLDLDPHVCASVHMRLYPEEQPCTLFRLFMGAPPEQTSLWAELVVRPEGQRWDMAPGDTRLADVEGELRDRPGKGFLLRAALECPRPKYEFIILDCPPNMGLLLINALVAADLLIIPIQTDFLALHGVKLLFDTLRVLNRGLSRPVRYMALATMYDKRAGACTAMLQLLRRKMDRAMFNAVIPVDTRLREAGARGKVVYDIAPSCRAAAAYALLAEEVIALW